MKIESSISPLSEDPSLDSVDNNAHSSIPLLYDSRQRSGENPVRKLLEVACDPGFISFAGGLPDSSLFPVNYMQETQRKLIQKYGRDILNYGATTGLPQFRQTIAEYLHEQHIEVTPRDVLAVASSQLGLYATAKTLLEQEGDIIAVESPTYLGALNAFDRFKPRYVSLESDQQGVRPDSIRKALHYYPDLKFMYLLPTFSNPTGKTVPEDRRAEIASILEETGTIAIEDDPYGKLRFEGTPEIPIKNKAPNNVIYLSTGSKIYAPDLRTAFMAAPREFQDKKIGRARDIQQELAAELQAMILFPSQVNQLLLSEFMQDKEMFEHHLNTIRELYKRRKDIMLLAMMEYFPEDFTVTHPEGGLFIWGEGTDRFDMRAVFNQALAQNVAFVTGRAFYPDENEGNHSARFNFSNQPEDRIVQGIKKIGAILKKQ